MVNVQQTSIVVAAVPVVYTIKNSQECISMVLVYMYVHICKCASKKTKCLVCIEILSLLHQLEKHQNDIQLEGINRHHKMHFSIYKCIFYPGIQYIHMCHQHLCSALWGRGRGLEKRVRFVRLHKSWKLWMTPWLFIPTVAFVPFCKIVSAWDMEYLKYHGKYLSMV